MAGYLLHNKKLRDELAKAKDAEDAAKMLGKHLQKDGKKLAKQVQEFVASDDVQKNVKKAKHFTKKKIKQGKEELDSLVCKGTSKAKKTAKKGCSKAKKSVKKGVKKAKRKVSKKK